MSNSLAVAAVTATLRDILSRVAGPLPIDPEADPELVDAQCTTKPLDKARSRDDQNQLNLFLFRATPNAAFRNADPIREGRVREASPLALDLHYLITAYGKNSDDVLAHRLLGRAMSLLHDHAVLSPSAIDVALKGNDLGRQVERVRVTPQPLSTEEISKLWAIFQTPYRVSAAYQVSVVLIDSSRRGRAALPALNPRVTVVPDLKPVAPTLTLLQLPADQPAARLPIAGSPSFDGDTVRFCGHHLMGTSVTATFAHPLLAAPHTLDVADNTDTGFSVRLPTDAGNWPAGIYTTSATIRSASGEHGTNALALAVAPRIVSVTKDFGAAPPRITVDVSPQVWPSQRATLSIGSTEYQAEPRAEKTGRLDFLLPGIASGEHLLRIRVGGVDGLYILYQSVPPTFDPALLVAIP